MGLLRMAARTAVVAGTATAVSGRVANKQQQKYAAQEQEQQAQQAQAAPAPVAPAPAPEPAPAADDSMAQLQKLADLHKAGVLTDEEFSASKAKILGI